jgi:zinc D-Ala-D-Ala carboxypeptidase
MSKYFSDKEMQCQHCGALKTDPDFMDALDSLREAYGKPLVVNSGYRCPEHPIEARKARTGAHTTGKAVDLSVDRGEAYLLLKLAMESGKFTGIGIQQKGSGRFIHLDTCEEPEMSPRPTIWSY